MNLVTPFYYSLDFCFHFYAEFFFVLLPIRDKFFDYFGYFITLNQ